MRDSLFQGEVKINYILRKPQNAMDTLVVVFPGMMGMRGNEGTKMGYTYMNTLAQFNVNALFLRAGADVSRASKLVCQDRDFKVERTIVNLIEQAKEETGSKRVIAVGSSMGGWTCIYYGLKYGYDIISGSPAYLIGKGVTTKCMAGETNEESIAFCNALMPNAIKQAAENGFDKYIFVSWGKGERVWVDKRHGKQMLSDLDSAGIEYTHKLYDFYSHSAVHWVFPDVVKQQISKLLGLTVTEEAEEEPLSELQKTNLKIIEKCRFIKSELLKINKSLPVSKVANVTQYGNNDSAKQLSTFIDGSLGYFSLPKLKKPYYIGSADKFWECIPQKNMSYAISFSFQQTLLNYYKITNNSDVLEFLEENTQYYLKNAGKISKVNRDVYMKFENSMKRLHYFIDWSNVLNEPPTKRIIEVILFALKVMLSRELRLVMDSEKQYLRIISILHVAAYFREDAESFDSIYSTVLDILTMLNNYYFDKDGVALYGHLQAQHLLYKRIKVIDTFISTNNFPVTVKLKRIRRHIAAIENATKHMVSLSGVVPNLGNTSASKAKVIRKSGNFISPSSNFAVLSDDKKTYITINSGNPYHSINKHCDLLSFTFWYDGHYLVRDAGGGIASLSDYACSAVAHSALICENSDYVIPEYNDFTVIDDFTEKDEYVLIKMSHRLYADTGIYRTFLWLKPNVIILFDYAESDNEQSFAQNFLLEKNAMSYLEITQHSGDCIQEEYKGTANTKAANLRGSYIENFKKLVPSLNKVYIQNGKTAEFMTVLEAHTGKENELNVKTVQTKGVNVTVTFEDGKEMTISRMTEAVVKEE